VSRSTGTTAAALRFFPQRLVVVLLLSSMPVAGCGRKRALEDMAGSYTRVEMPIPLPIELNLTTTGMVVQGGASISEGIDIGGKSLITLGARLGSVKPGAVEFESVTCDANACRFKSKVCPSGSLTRDPQGDLIVIADGDCSSWSGRWSPTGLAKAGTRTMPSVQDFHAGSSSGTPAAGTVSPPPVPAAPSSRSSPPLPSVNTCQNAEDCPSIACECEDGSSINTRSCVNGVCPGADRVCVGPCVSHEGVRGTWDPTMGKKLGVVCRRDDDCASNTCLTGYCTKPCDSFSDCPSFWSCESAPKSTTKVCRSH
jgi:hypothetical protein